MSRKRSSSIPSPAVIDRGWPHQVALQDDLCGDRNFDLLQAYFDRKGLKPHTRSVLAKWQSGQVQDFRLYCFADQADAREFRAIFGGQTFNPATDRDGGRAFGIWHRNDLWTRLVESGPLSVPTILRT